MTRDSAPPHDAFAISAPGLERLVAGELTELGVRDSLVLEGGVEFAATQRQLYESNLHLRTASRIVVRLAKFRALTFAELEKRARRIPWERVIAHGDRVTLRVTCRKSRLYHSDAVAQRLARDLKERLGVDVGASRGDVDDPESADEGQLIIVRFDHDHCTVSADSSGAHLHQRGYRTSVTEAPMRETLAAALVLASGWDQSSPFLDPFCGSGTIPIEAAMIAADVAPGRNRPFRFMQWPGYDAGLWHRTLTAAKAREKLAAATMIRGSDRSAAAIRAATDNAQRSGVGSVVQFERLDALRVADPKSPTGWLVTNPPYGVRLGDEAETHALMTAFARTLTQRFAGWRLALLAPARFERLAGIRLLAGPRTTNGGLRVQILTGVVPVRERQVDN